MLSESVLDFEALQEYKRKVKALAKPDTRFFNLYIADALENFLTALEEKVESLGEQAIHDEELNYGAFDDE